MSTQIHPLAVVEDGATIGNGCRIGPFCHVGSAIVVAVALSVAGSLVFLVPIGEAPDEPAHLSYVVVSTVLSITAVTSAVVVVVGTYW